MSIDDQVRKHHVQIWRTLKALTEGESKNIVCSVKDEDGFEAWHKLNRMFETSLENRQGMVLTEFNDLIKSPAKTPGELRKMITEMENKMKTVEDITKVSVNEFHAKSVLMGIMDPLTRQHTAMQHQPGDNFNRLKENVLKFTNNAVTELEMGKSLGAVTIPKGDDWGGQNDWGGGEGDDWYVGSFGKG